MSCKTVVPNLFGTRNQLCGRQFFHGWGWGKVSWWFKHITFTQHFVSIITLAPPQIIRHQILEAGTPDVKVWTKELQDPQRIYFLPSAKGDRGTPLSPSLREQEGVHNTPTGHLQRLPTSKRNRSRPPPVLRISGVCVGGGVTAETFTGYTKPVPPAPGHRLCIESPQITGETDLERSPSSPSFNTGGD